MSINVVNPEDIREYHAKFAEGDETLARLLNVALRKPILNMENCFHIMSEAEDYGPNAPSWLVKKFQENSEDNFFIFIAPDDYTEEYSKILHVRDWIKGAINRGEEWTNENKPERLTHFRSLDDAYAAADLASRALRAKFNVNTADPIAGTTIVMEFPDGWKIRSLDTVEAKQYDGKKLKHCVGDGAYDDEKIFSLRNPEGKPVITMQSVQGRLSQCMGIQNSPPTEIVMPYIGAFLKHEGLGLPKPHKFLFMRDENITLLGMVARKDKLYSLYNLPAGTHIRGVLDLTRTLEDLKLPENMKVTSLTIRAKKLPDGFCRQGDIETNVQIPDSINAESLIFRTLHKGQRHSKGGPAEIFYSKNSIIHTWCKHGTEHRQDGPALIEYNQQGLIADAVWILNGEEVSAPSKDKRFKGAYTKWREHKKAHNEAVLAGLSPSPSPQLPAA